MLKPDKDNTKQKKKGRRKLLILITEEHRCKNSQQNTSNPNSIHYKDHTPWSSGTHLGDSRISQYPQIKQCDTPHKEIEE